MINNNNNQLSPLSLIQIWIKIIWLLEQILKYLSSLHVFEAPHHELQWQGFWVTPLVQQGTLSLLKIIVPWGMTTDAHRPTEPKEELLANLLLTAVSLKLSCLSSCLRDTLEVATIVGHRFNHLPACLLSNSRTSRLHWSHIVRRKWAKRQVYSPEGGQLAKHGA